MLELARMVASDKEFRNLILKVPSSGPDVLVSGLSGSARHVHYAAQYLIAQERHPGASLLVVAGSANQAEGIADDLREFLPEVPVLIFPERELSVADVIASSPEVVADRINTLLHLTAGKSAIVVATVSSALQPVVTKALLQSYLLDYEVGQSVPMPNHLERLVECGYERTDLVEHRGQFSVRGGIIDIFPLTADEAVRIELFDTEVDSIRTFDVATQRSLEKLKSVRIGPAADFLVPQHVMRQAADAVTTHLEQRVRTTPDVAVRDRLQSVVGEDTRRLASALPFYGQLRYTQLFGTHVSTLLQYFPADSMIILDEPSRLQERQKGLEREFSEWVSAALLRGELLSGTIAPLAFAALWEHKMAGAQYSMFARPPGQHRLHAILNVAAKTMQNFHGQMNLLKSETLRWAKSGMQVVLLAATEERAERLERVLNDYRIDTIRTDALLPTSTPQILQATLSAGFELPLNRLVVIVETEVFATKKKNRRYRQDMTDAERIKSYLELKAGDFVVHVNHGIGKYLGIRTLEIDGRHKDYLHLSYAGNDNLYVPVEQIDLVQRYVGAEDKEPKVYHLGGADWNRVKQKVSRTVRDIAEDLVKLYAAREATPGHPFAPDTPWQKDFEATFPYEETPDQVRAIRDITEDMERPRPMDRLLCGDVGYGKTEVAIRAAFKAVMDGKQVAVLVPTTVLAHQHFETFKERFVGFPVTVDVLSRFRSRGESQNVMKGLQDGSVDIVIGTHRLLQKTIQFKDLGLLIVDEEQRFGVTHKERLKQIRTNVDCLTLTATPIPRTLHMSMLGVRDLSVIETPPENRFPVQTYVVEQNESLLREALERELNRDGQVYVLYNNVGGIQSMADRVLRLIPDARVAIAHGQMAENELERVMIDFLDGDIDVLVTTTIIETGLDIPNVNTLIVHDADRFGLSQLYQLRGRVGRSNRIAYAYFTYQKDKVLTEVAEKRLQAIKEFTELGSGFKIAMRDLTIRGAGNLLGAEQHGFMNSVGFDMYSEMLAQAVKDIRGDTLQEPPEPTIELALEAYLPDSFIADTAQKIAMYKKFKFVRSLAAANDLEDELEDRYGDLPDPVRTLLDITRMKACAQKYGVESVTATGPDIVVAIRRDAQARIDHGKLFVVTKQHQGQYMKRPNGNLHVVFRLKGLADGVVCKHLLRFLQDLSSVWKTDEVAEEIAK